MYGSIKWQVNNLGGKEALKDRKKKKIIYHKLNQLVLIGS